MCTPNCLWWLCHRCANIYVHIDLCYKALSGVDRFKRVLYKFTFTICLSGPGTGHCPNYWLQHREVQDIQVAVCQRTTTFWKFKNIMSSSYDFIISSQINSFNFKANYFYYVFQLYAVQFSEQYFSVFLSLFVAFPLQCSTCLVKADTETFGNTTTSKWASATTNSRPFCHP